MCPLNRDHLIDRFGNGLPDISNAFGPADSSTATLAGTTDRTTFWSFSPPYILSGTLTITTTASGGGAQWTVRAHSEYGQPAPHAPSYWCGAGGAACDPLFEGWFGGSSGVYNPTINGQVGSLYFSFKSQVLTFDTVNLDSMEILFTGEQCQAAATPPTCELVPNADFETDENWIFGLGGSVAITNSVLSLGSGGYVVQPLAGLDSASTYIANLDVTQVSTETTLSVVLGDRTKEILVEAPGSFSAVFAPQSIFDSSANFKIENVAGGDIDIDFACLSNLQGTGVSCLSNDSWALSENSRLISSGLILNNNSEATQPVSDLEMGKTYLVRIDVGTMLYSLGDAGSPPAQPPSIGVKLGQNSKSILVDGPGVYEVQMSTPANLSPPYQFTLEHKTTQTPSLVGINSVCFFLSSTSDALCLGPANGDFNQPGPGQAALAANWAFFNGATWSSQSKDVILPPGDPPMLQSTQPFTLPQPNSQQYLILGYDAYSVGGDGNIGAGLADGPTIIFDRYADVYPDTHSFEFDISPFAGQPVSVLFGNFGDSELVLDNVCVWLSYAPPGQLPIPTTPGAIPPVDLGINISCSDVDAIWASFGVNMLQHRSDYLAGISFWDDPLSWLASIFWIVLGDWSCMFVAAWLGLIKVFEYSLNIFLNIASWFILSSGEFVDWLNSWGYWLRLSGLLVSLGFGGFLAAWFLWGGESAEVATEWTATEGGRVAEWLVSLVLSDSGGGLSPSFLSFISQFIPGGVVLAFLIWLVDVLFGLLSGLAGAIFEMLFMFFWWLWEDFVSVGNTPLQFYYGFENGINSPAYSVLVDCANNNFWCAFLAGVQIVNVTVSQTVFYPIVIVGIVLSTVVILWQNIVDLFS